MRPDGDPTVFIDLFLGAILCPPIAYFGWKYWKRKASECWSKATAAFEGGSLEVRTYKGSERYSVAMTFTYQIADQTFHGEYKKSLPGYREKEANQLLRSLEDGPLYIRYRPSKPKDYVCDPFRDVRP